MAYVRGLIFVAVLLVSSLLPVQAYATVTREQAMAACEDAGPYPTDQPYSGCYDSGHVGCDYWDTPGGSGIGYICVVNNNRHTTCGDSCYFWSYTYDWTEPTDCSGVAAGQADSESALYNPTSNIQTVSGSSSSCIGGCEWAVSNDDVGSVSWTVGGETYTNGHFQFTGESCDNPDEDPVPTEKPETPTDDVCTPAPHGQTYCVTQEGKFCATSSNGHKACWDPGQTGTRVAPNSDEAQDLHDASDSPPTVPGLTPATSTDVTEAATDTSDTTTTTDNELTLYNETGIPDTTSGGDGDEGDTALLQAIKSNTAGTKDGVNAIKDALTGDGYDPDSRGDDGQAGDGDAAGVSEDKEFGEDGLDTDGYGASRTCPVMPDVTVMGHTVHVDTTKMCEWFQISGQIVLLLAALISLRIMTGAN